MLLHHAGVQFEDEAVAFADWPTKKATMPNGQMPVWIDEAGNVLSQSISILNALAREHGYEPKGLLGNWANSWVSSRGVGLWSWMVSGAVLVSALVRNILAL